MTLFERRWDGLGGLARPVLLFAGCLVLGLGLSQLGVRYLRDPQLPASLWWPLGGIGVALLSRLRHRDWPAALGGLAAGQFLTNVSTFYSSPSALGILAATVGETLIIALLLRRVLGAGVLLNSPRRAFQFAFCAAVGVVLGSSIFALAQPSANVGPWELWNAYFRTHALGLLMVSPVFLASSDTFRRHRLNLEWAAQFAAVGLSAGGIFLTHQRVVPAFVCVLPLLWGGLRLGPVRAMISLLLLGLISTIGTLRGLGPMVHASPVAQNLSVQVLLVTATVGTLFVVLAAAEKARLLDLATIRGEDLAQAERMSGLGSSTTDLITGEARWSDGLWAQLGHEPGSLRPAPETFMNAVHPDDREHVRAARARLLEAGSAPEMQFRLLRADGSQRIMRVRSKVDHGPDGRALRVRSTTLDVTLAYEAESALQRAHLKLGGVLEAVDAAVVGIDARTRLIESFNHGAEALLGWRADEVVGIHGPLIYHSAADQERAVSETSNGDPVLGWEPQRWTCVRKDRSDFPAQGGLNVLRGPDGEPETYIVTIVDLTEVLRAEAELQESEERFRLFFQSASSGMAIVSLDPDDLGRIVRANPALCRFAASPEQDLQARYLPDLMPPGPAEATLAELRGFLSGSGDALSIERAFHDPDGGERWGLMSIARVRPAAGQAPYLIVTIEDLTAQMQLTERLRHEASHDPLTGLPNRQGVRERLEDVLTGDEKHPDHAAVAVLYVDLDGFKAVNDTLGYSVGDELLVQVAERISRCVRSGDVVARLGADKFVILLPRVGNLATAQAIGDRIVRAMGKRFDVGSARCAVGASIGVALSAPEDSAPDLLNAADEAMYEAKRAGKGQVRVSGR